MKQAGQDHRVDRRGEADEFLQVLERREGSIAIWGSGAIGSSAAYYFAQAGFRCVAYDISKDRVRDIQEGHFQSTGAELGVTNVHPGQKLEVTATTHWHDLEAQNIRVHLVSVPTERAAEPSGAALSDVIPRIGKVIRKTEPGAIPPVISIESTILPSWLDTLVCPGLQSEGLKVGTDVLVGAAPRRDWFNGANYTIETLPRIVGGCDDRTTDLLCALYRTVCKIVQPAIDARHAAFTKIVENVIRYEGITFGNKLALAFPEFDMRHVLRLASTKWNIPYYFPSLGVGGHCIPLAPQYLVEEGGLDNPYLDSVRESITFNESYFESLYGRRLENMLKERRSVAVLGLAYTPDAKMHKLSPAFSILDALRQTPRLRLHDPFYSSEEIYDLCSVPTMHFPDDLEECDAIILVTAHSEYVRTEIEKYILDGTVVIDNTGAWATRPFKNGVEYYEVGRIRSGKPPHAEPYSSTAD